MKVWWHRPRTWALVCAMLGLVQSLPASATRVEGASPAVSLPRTNALVLATQSLEPRREVRRAPRAARPAGDAAVTMKRAATPLDTTAASGPEQPGYVHYFLLTWPDESLETLVGIELPGKKIAWSFPEAGVVVVPLAAQATITAGGKEFKVSHLYGIRPFPEDSAMAELRGALPARVGRWVEAGTPWCENDGPAGGCMSCLGFVLRVLFPGRASDFPEMPADFGRAGHPRRYSTEDLLLYLTGMFELPSRAARLKRIDALDVPPALREDVSELVKAMEDAAPAGTASAAAPRPAAHKPAVRPARVTVRSSQRKRL
jgi:hypothetical protein